ncbi:amidohydrolase [Brachybacterium avium]|uniref:Amidohydrolase n=1 Tax=Brachybacterium avium TaxID=2017485 RepID=A0A220UDP6_9MICO|nr:amidohydrolase [Brachybacterium avium]ASK66215.1 amidohydrolase [Brachybacterium avium]
MTANLYELAIRWRRELHRIPGIAFDVGETADFVARICTDLGWEVTTGVGGSGVVASLTRGTSTRSIALRADMDGLPIEERTGVAHSSRNAGAMHACGHDGHMAMVLGAAAALTEGADWEGTVRLVFQPAEEPGTGAEAMLADGLFARFPIDEIYGLHNLPGLPEGEIHTRSGPLMAAEDNFEIAVTGRGGHASAPHLVLDPLVIAAGIARAHRAVSEVSYTRVFRPTINDPGCARHATAAAAAAVGDDRVDPTCQPITASEDFAAFARAVPACFALLGAGEIADDGTAPLHSRRFDYNDAILPVGIDYFTALVRARLTKENQA